MRKLPIFLTENQIHRMFVCAKNNHSERDEKILKLLYYFGLRNNEMCNLHVKHVNFDDMTLKVVQGKGKKDRIIPIIDINMLPDESDTIVDDLKKWTKDQDGLFVTGGSSGGSISDRHVRRIVKGYADEAGIFEWEEVHPHTLRHSYATHLKNIGVPLEIIQRLLGHEKIDTTTIYAHIGIENLRSEVKKYLAIKKIKDEMPVMIKLIRNEKDMKEKMIMQNNLILKLLIVFMGLEGDPEDPLSTPNP